MTTNHVRSSLRTVAHGKYASAVSCGGKAERGVSACVRRRRHRVTVAVRWRGGGVMWWCV